MKARIESGLRRPARRAYEPPKRLWFEERQRTWYAEGKAEAVRRMIVEERRPEAEVARALGLTSHGLTRYLGVLWDRLEAEQAEEIGRLARLFGDGNAG